MKVEVWGYTHKDLAVGFCAMMAAFHENASFTVEAFCKKYSFKPNRHTRRALNEMVADGILTKHKTLYNDGHYRMVYAAQKTARTSAL
jgi:hypothetical protein